MNRFKPLKRVYNKLAKELIAKQTHKFGDSWAKPYKDDYLARKPHNHDNDYKRLLTTVKDTEDALNDATERYFNTQRELEEFEHQEYEECPRCKAVSVYPLSWCWLCDYRPNKNYGFALNFRERKGGYVMTESEQRFASDFRNTHQKEMVQPTRYNNVTKKVEKNPDFVKLYGDPERKHNVGGNLNVKESQ